MLLFLLCIRIRFCSKHTQTVRIRLAFEQSLLSEQLKQIYS